MPAMPGIDVDPEPELTGLEAAGFADERGRAVLAAGCDVASTTVVAASTRTAAVTTVASAAHHSRAAVPRPTSAHEPFLDSPHCAPPRAVVGVSIDSRCEGGATPVLGNCEPGPDRGDGRPAGAEVSCAAAP